MKVPSLRNLLPSLLLIVSISVGSAIASDGPTSSGPLPSPVINQTPTGGGKPTPLALPITTGDTGKLPPPTNTSSDNLKEHGNGF